MSSYSGLSAAHRADARNQIIKDARLLLSRASLIGYSQGSNRWDLISRNLSPWQVTTGDCSSMDGYLLWRALRHRVSHDIVNGTNWHGGFTGTMLTHGKTVQNHADSHLKIGDCAIFGPYPGRHVIIRVGTNRWLSHGSWRGPLLVSLGYRSDLNVIKRYI